MARLTKKQLASVSEDLRFIHYLDPRIQDVILALNQLSFLHTTFSCQGYHWLALDPPYIIVRYNPDRIDEGINFHFALGEHVHSLYCKTYYYPNGEYPGRSDRGIFEIKPYKIDKFGFEITEDTVTIYSKEGDLDKCSVLDWWDGWRDLLGIECH